MTPAARRPAVGARRPFYRRRKSCPFSGPNAPKIDYKDVRLLSRFLSGARQDRAEPHHRGQREEAARAGECHQARPLPGAAALRHQRLGAEAQGEAWRRCRRQLHPDRVATGWAAQGYRRGGRRAGRDGRCLWAFRGLPLGTALFWMAPFPLFAAGLAFGPASALAGSLLAVLLVAVAGGGLPVLVFLALFALPVPLLLLAAPPERPLRLGAAARAARALAGGGAAGRAASCADDGGLEPAMRGRSRRRWPARPAGTGAAGGGAGAGQGGGDRLLDQPGAAGQCRGGGTSWPAVGGGGGGAGLDGGAAARLVPGAAGRRGGLFLAVPKAAMRWRSPAC